MIKIGGIEYAADSPVVDLIENMNQQLTAAHDEVATISTRYDPLMVKAQRTDADLRVALTDGLQLAKELAAANARIAEQNKDKDALLDAYELCHSKMRELDATNKELERERDALREKVREWIIVVQAYLKGEVGYIDVEEVIREMRKASGDD